MNQRPASASQPDMSGNATTAAIVASSSGKSTKPGAPAFRAKRRVQEHYQIVGFINSGTYGRVYKAEGVGRRGVFAIKKFKPDTPVPNPTTNNSPAASHASNYQQQHTYTGISQSAIREMSLCAELVPAHHPNIISLVETILQDAAIYMIFGFCEHDLLQIIHTHSTALSHAPIAHRMLRNIVYQLLSGVAFLHKSWILHRDIKPANIMVTSGGCVKIGDLGLARIFREPLIPLSQGDKVVVTIWYRAPELLLGARHYTPAIDAWAVGCVIGELVALRPMFKGEEVRQDNNSQHASTAPTIPKRGEGAIGHIAAVAGALGGSGTAAAGVGAGGGVGAGIGVAAGGRDRKIPFQRNQMERIVKILGMPNEKDWPLLRAHPEASQLAAWPSGYRGMGLDRWYSDITTQQQQQKPQSQSQPQQSPQRQGQHKRSASSSSAGGKTDKSNSAGQDQLTKSTLMLDLLRNLLQYDPDKRLTAAQALEHECFTTTNDHPLSLNCFEGIDVKYPKRKIADPSSKEALTVPHAAALAGQSQLDRKRKYGM